MEREKVYRAGTIPYWIDSASNQVYMMFMRPSNPDFGGFFPQLAKGRIEDGEDAKTAAIREAKEELGLFIGNVISTDELGTFMGRTTVFLAKIKDRNMFGEPGFETSEVAWLTAEEFDQIGRDLHRPVVKAAVRKIKLIEGL